MDIRCVRLVAYEISSRTYLDIEQVIPLRQAADYQVRIRRKDQQQEKALIEGGADWTRYQIMSSDRSLPRGRGTLSPGGVASCAKTGDARQRMQTALIISRSEVRAFRPRPNYGFVA